MKKIVLILLAITFLLCTAACEGDNKNSPDNKSVNESFMADLSQWLETLCNIEVNQLLQTIHKITPYKCTVTDILAITSRDCVLICKIEKGTVNVGDRVDIYNGTGGCLLSLPIDAIEVSRKIVKKAQEGDIAALLFQGTAKRDLKNARKITNQQ